MQNKPEYLVRSQEVENVEAIPSKKLGAEHRGDFRYGFCFRGNDRGLVTAGVASWRLRLLGVYYYYGYFRYGFDVAG